MSSPDTSDADLVDRLPASDPPRLAETGRELSLAVLVWIAIGAVLLPVLLFAAAGFVRWVASERAQEVERVQQHATTLARAVDSALQGYLNVTEVLAGTRHLRVGDLATFDDIARDAAAKAGGDFGLIDRTFRQLINTRAERGAALPRVGQIDSTKLVFDTGKGLVSGLYVGAVSQKFSFAVRVPVWVDGEVRYVLNYVPEKDAIFDVVEQTVRPAGWYGAVIDGNGRIIARSERDSDYMGKSAAADFLAQLTGTSGLVESKDLEGRLSTTAYHATTLGDWRVIVWAPKALLQEPVNQAQSMVLSLILVTLLLSVTAAWVVGRTITAPTVRLVREAQALGSGLSVEFRPAVMREANIIGRALKEAADEIAVREARLRDSEARFRNMADHAPVMIWVTDPQGSASYLSASWYEFTGRPAQSGLGRGWLEPVHPEDRERTLSTLLQASDERLPVSVEYRMRRADGQWRWVIDSAQPRMGRNRRFLGYIGSVVDITERRQREEQINLLMREVNHRSKNMLGLVLAVARQTLATNPVDFVARFTERIQAMSASQDLLVNNDWQGVDIGELLTVQLAHFADLMGKRISLDGPPLRLLPAAAQSLGMALHELSTNAGKYGALSSDSGRVDVHWNVQPGQDPMFVLDWHESGGPPVVPPERRGFGSTVVGPMVRLGTGGTVELDYDEAGVRWTLTCPADAVIDQAVLAELSSKGFDQAAQ